jgi:hypothetical protein
VDIVNNVEARIYVGDIVDVVIYGVRVDAGQQNGRDVRWDIDVRLFWSCAANALSGTF